MPPLTHSKLGASSASQWMNCPASVRMSEGVKDESSTYANEGSAAHDLAERCLRGWSNAVEFLGETIEYGGDTFVVDIDMVDAVQEYLDIVRGDLAEALDCDDFDLDLMRSKLDTVPINFGVENRFHLEWLHPILYGTNDAYIGDPLGTLRVYDYKHGAGVPVSAYQNPQLLYYALGCLGEHNMRLYENVEIIVVQPRCHVSDVITRWRVSVKDLYAWGREQLLPAAIRALEDDAPRVVGEIQCRWCKARGRCPDLADANMDLVCAAFGEDGASPVAMPPVAANLTSEQLGQINMMLPLFEGWVRSVKGEIATRLQAGDDPEVLYSKLVKKRALRGWKDIGVAQTQLIDGIGNEVLEVKLKSPAKVEKIIKSQLKGRKHTEERTAMLEWLAQFIETPDNGYTVARLDDNRAAVPASEAFGDYTQAD